MKRGEGFPFLDLSFRFTIRAFVRDCDEDTKAFYAIVAIPNAPGYILISISTPAGRFKLIRASIVRSVGFMISIKRLWIRISYWSRDCLSIKVERLTV